jgi:hypothetical protein
MTQSAVPGAIDIGQRLRPQPGGQISPACNQDRPHRHLLYAEETDYGTQKRAWSFLGDGSGNAFPQRNIFMPGPISQTPGSRTLGARTRKGRR